MRYKLSEDPTNCATDRPTDRRIHELLVALLAPENDGHSDARAAMRCFPKAIRTPLAMQL
eukprot:5763395-Pyramimonas_sp.AAC.1